MWEDRKKQELKEAAIAEPSCLCLLACQPGSDEVKTW